MVSIRRILIGLLPALLLTQLLAAAPTAVSPDSGLITGSVTLGGNPLAGATVRAYQGDPRGGVTTVTGQDGRFSLSVSTGSWLVVPEPLPADLWMYTGGPRSVSFESGSPSLIDLSFTVQATTGFLVGSVRAGDAPLPAPPAGVAQPFVDVFDIDTLVGRQAPIDATGAFTVPLVPGFYQLDLKIDTSAPIYAGYEIPQQILRQIVSGTVDVGPISLLRRDAAIVGVVKAQGVGVAGVQIQAVRTGGGFGGAITAADGSFRITAAAGEWVVSAFPGDGFIDFAVSTPLSVAPGEEVSVALELTPAAAVLAGSLLVNGVAVTDVDGWAYARNPASGAYVAYGRIAGGTFALTVPAGELRVGVLLAAGSPYSLIQETETTNAARARLAAGGNLSGVAAEALEHWPYEQTVAVKPAVGSPVVRPVAVRLVRNDAVIRGRLVDATGQALTGIQGTIAATPVGVASTWQTATITLDTGVYELKVAEGTWLVSYRIEAGKGYEPASNERLLVSVGAGGSTTQDIAPRALDGVIVGRVLDSQDRPVAGALIWLSGNNLFEYTLSDDTGLFRFDVPLNAGRVRAAYTLGMQFSCEGKPVCYLGGDTTMVEARPVVTAATIANTPAFAELRARDVGNEIRVTGRITVNNDNTSGVAVVSERLDDGSVVATSTAATTNSGGRFNNSLAVGTLTGLVQVRTNAVYATGGQAYSNSSTRSVNLTSLGQLDAAEIENPLGLEPVATLPNSVVETFTVAEGWRFTLGDGTSVEIPPFAAPLAATARVRVVMEPAPIIFGNELHRVGTYYGYTISLFDDLSGVQLVEPLRQPALLNLRYSDDDIWARDAMEARLQPARLVGANWAPATTFTLATGVNRLSVQTTELGTWAIVQPANRGCGACVFLPMLGR